MKAGIGTLITYIDLTNKALILASMLVNSDGAMA
jgi:hypothetical protein